MSLLLKGPLLPNSLLSVVFNSSITSSELRAKNHFRLDFDKNCTFRSGLILNIKKLKIS